MGPSVDASGQPDNLWTLTISREVRELGGGVRSTVEPWSSAEVPAYRVDAGIDYSEAISPVSGQTALRGGDSWYDAEGGRPVVSVLSPAFDELAEGRRISLQRYAAL